MKMKFIKKLTKYWHIILKKNFQVKQKLIRVILKKNFKVKQKLIRVKGNHHQISLLLI